MKRITMVLAVAMLGACDDGRHSNEPDAAPRVDANIDGIPAGLVSCEHAWDPDPLSGSPWACDPHCLGPQSLDHVGVSGCKYVDPNNPASMPACSRQTKQTDTESQGCCFVTSGAMRWSACVF